MADGTTIDQIRRIGCCGAHCGTCPPLFLGTCKGCKLGYSDGSRDIKDARCAIKLCCFGAKGLETCADCPDHGSCRTINGFFEKKGYKYGKYRQSLEYIHAHGYQLFLERTKDWKRAYGKL